MLVVESRWFAPLVAIVQTARHAALIGLSYWSAVENIGGSKVEEIVRRDWGRPLLEPYGFCGAWTSYDPYLTAAMGLDAPAYVAAALVHTALTLEPSCIDAMTTVRGQVIMAPFVGLLWLCTGLSLRRLAQRRCKPRLQGDFGRGLAFLVLFGAAAFAMLLLLMSLLGAFVSDAAQIARGLGLALWMSFAAALASERLRIWPFAAAVR